MRRNLTISFDEQFIEKMDDRRGAWSRGVYIEELFADQDNMYGPDKPLIDPAVTAVIAKHRGTVFGGSSVSPKLRSGIKPRPKGGKK